MRYIKSYTQLNESAGSDILKTLLDKFSNNIDSKKLAELILPNKDILLPYYKKYVKDGVIQADMIYSDFSKFNFKANEGYWDKDYADDKNNHPVLRFLYKLFVRWPKNLITGIWEIFYDTVIDTWKDSKFMSILMGVLWILTAMLIYLLGYITYSVVEHSINGLESGIVKSEGFKPAHYELRPHTITNGKTTTTYYTNDYIPDTWYIEVEGENGRVETWQTTNSQVGENIEEGDQVINDDNWTWCETDEE
jgi:hypothetical protein